MQLTQEVLLPRFSLTVETRISFLYTPVYLVGSDKVPAKLVVKVITSKKRIGFLCARETKQLLCVSTFFNDQVFWSQVAEAAARVRRELPWAAKFFYDTLREIKRNKDEMLTISMTHIA